MESAIEKVDYVKIEFSSIYQNGETEEEGSRFLHKVSISPISSWIDRGNVA